MTARTRRLCVLLALLFLTAALVEFGLRQDWVGSKPLFWDLYRPSLARGCYYECRPHFELGTIFFDGHERRPDGRMNAVLANGRFRLNAYGLRGPDLAPGILASVRPILCLGDGSTFGAYCREADTFPVLLERLLQARGPALVINGAVPGYQPPQYRAEYHRWAPVFRPSTVVVGLTMNDLKPLKHPLVRAWIADTTVLGSHLVDGLEALQSRMPGPRNEEAFTGRFLHSVNRSTIRSLRELAGLAGLPAREQFRRVGEYTDGNWGPALDELRRLNEECRQSGVTLICVVLPTQQQVRPGFTYDEPQKRIAAYFRAHGIRFVDMLPRFRAARAGGYPCFPFYTDEVHFNAFAHRLVAASLFEFLRHPPASPLPGRVRSHS